MRVLAFTWSGAEGTIIEDADLPRMIWGLDLTDTQSNSAREAPTTKTHSNAQSLNNPQPPSSKPAAHNTSYDLESVDRGIFAHNGIVLETTRGTPTRNNLKPFAHVPEPNNLKAYETHTEKPQDWKVSPIDIHALNPSSKTVDIALFHPSKKMSDLKPSAPPFIPNISPTSTTCIFIDPKAGSRITAGRRLSAIEIARKYHAEHKQNTRPLVPTLPLSWSPAPFTVVNPHTLDYMPLRLREAREMIPSYPSRASNSRRDFSAEISQVKATQRELSNIIAFPSIDYSDTTLSCTSRKDPRAPISSPQDSFVRPSSAIDISLVFERLNSAHSLVVPNTAPPDLLSPQSTLLHPQSRILQGTRPQSIPMARLMQRRLSIVPEEDSSSSTNNPQALPQSDRHYNHESLDTVCDGVNCKTSKALATTRAIDTSSELHHEAARDSEDKENATKLSTRTNTEKATGRRKWRHRKKGDARPNSHQNKRN
ncbi:hypothetical protein H0H87_010893 [Tephrocybe sp. NHM501043]|nr:hypothetical protein H0H87_010893 [Tephrocybe sp. NHM501043]